jgi:hypothetical protein
MPKPEFFKPITELGSYVNLSTETFRKYLAMGAPKPPKTSAGAGGWVRKWKVWVSKNIKSWAQRQSEEAQERRMANGGNHEIDLKKWRAEEARIRVAEKQRELVSRKEVIAFAGNAILTVRGRLNAMVQKMQSRLENVPAHVVAEELQSEVDDICNAFADGMDRTHGSTEDE